MAENNPLYKLYEGIWTLLESSSDFRSEVATRRRIKYIGDSKEFNRQSLLAPSDYPEVRLLFTRFTPSVFRTSNGSSLTVRAEIQVGTGSMAIDSLTDVVWAVYRAMSGWQATMTAITWGGVAFIKKSQPVASEVNLNAELVNRQQQGWATVWAVDIDLWFSTATLKAFST